MIEHQAVERPALAAYAWRPARREDAPALHELLVAIEAVDRRGWSSTLEDRRKDFDDPESNYETDSRVVLAPDGAIAALGWVFTPPAGKEDQICFLWGEVHPAHRGRGLGEAVLAWTESRAGEILQDRPADVPHLLRTNCPDHLPDRVALFEAHGYEVTRRFYRMRAGIGPESSRPEIPLPAGVRIQVWTPEWNQEALACFNEAFQDHWGFIPVSDEIWNLFFIGSEDYRPDLSFLAFAQVDEVEKLVGFSMNQVRAASNAVNGIQEGWIQDLAVRRAWRRQGIASALLAASMRAFHAAGLDHAGLAVDTENLTGALRIYERLGFTPISRTLAYSKRVR